MDIIQIVLGSTVSIISIFISNYLGRKATKNNYQLETKDKAYKSFYVPLMKFLISANKDSMIYYWYIASWYAAPGKFKKSSDLLSDLLRSNLEVLPPKVVTLVSEYSTSTSGAQMFFGDDGYRENYRHNLIKASELFDTIVRQSLQEASLISKELGYPDIAKPILESFDNIEKTNLNFPRYLPEIYQKSGPRQFVGEEPPYY
ncbi:hypothetical protein BKP56_09335 [Marinilactibacillus sp. 15R]|uniref:hypothetical protein n=1 Tax=Marinilactibacillus sp. 15R TaxID=1911586 RepID=UPI00090B751D|nr:hypothetical protein [Marinilactibacillus sp. 15R]API89444.1 hypothetical protein BKP56_09335 [Marinilactibacillus sp. 15R]